MNHVEAQAEYDAWNPVIRSPHGLLSRGQRVRLHLQPPTGVCPGTDR